MYSIEVRKLRSGPTQYWVNGPDGKTIVRLTTREQAENWIARATAAAPTPVDQPAARPAGWSNAAKRRAGGRDIAGDYMAGSFGLVSPAAPGTCHYCGLSARTCDCH